MGGSESKASGSGSSRKHLDLPVLNAVAGNMVILSPEYVVLGQSPVVFRLPERWFTGPQHTVRELHSNGVILSTKGVRPAGGKMKEVWNANGTYAFGLKQVAASMLQPPHTLFNPAGQEVTKILVDAGTMKAMVRARVYDQAKGGNAIVLHFTFSFKSFTGTIYYGDPKEGAMPIANVYPDHPGAPREKHHYFMAVAPGVDVGICTAFCIALSEIRHRHE